MKFPVRLRQNGRGKVWATIYKKRDLFQLYWRAKVGGNPVSRFKGFTRYSAAKSAGDAAVKDQSLTQPDRRVRAKRKETSLKGTWQAKRAPFKGQSDCSPWWSGKPAGQIEPVAGLYELARRPPRLGKLRFMLRGAAWHGAELHGRPVRVAEERMLS